MTHIKAISRLKLIDRFLFYTALIVSIPTIFVIPEIVPQQPGLQLFLILVFVIGVTVLPRLFFKPQCPSCGISLSTNEGRYIAGTLYAAHCPGCGLPFKKEKKGMIS